MDRIFQKSVINILVLFSLNASADTIKFMVENKTSAKLIDLQISSNNHSWSSFSSVDLNPSESAVFEWIHSPESSCHQYVRGNFSQGGWSASVKVDFCIKQSVKITFGP